MPVSPGVSRPVLARIPGPALLPVAAICGIGYALALLALLAGFTAGRPILALGLGAAAAVVAAASAAIAAARHRPDLLGP